MTTSKRFGDLYVYTNGEICGPSLRPLQIKLSGKLEPYIVRGRKRVLVKDLVAHCFCEREADDTHVINRDWNPQNCHYLNLKWVTADGYRQHWGKDSGPPTVKALGKTALPENFFITVHQNGHLGLQYVKRLLERTEWHNHGLSDAYLRDIVYGRVRRDLFLKFKPKRKPER